MSCFLSELFETQLKYRHTIFYTFTLNSRLDLINIFICKIEVMNTLTSLPFDVFSLRIIHMNFTKPKETSWLSAKGKTFLGPSGKTLSKCQITKASY